MGSLMRKWWKAAFFAYAATGFWAFAAEPAQQPAAVGLGLNAREAVSALESGLKPEASLEAASFSGFKAQQALQGLGASEAPGAVRAGTMMRFGSSREDSGAAAAAAPRPAAGAPGDIPAPPPQPAQDGKKEGFLDRIGNSVGGAIGKFTIGFSEMSRGKKIALLSGLLVVEALTMIYPTTAITVLFTGLGVLGLIGTTRELIAAIRRGRS